MKSNIIHFTGTIALSIALVGCFPGKAPPPPVRYESAFTQQKGTFIDQRDNKTYEIVKIGTQTWMAQNLDYDAAGSKCYNNDESNCQKYGRLYNWVTAMNLSCKGRCMLRDNPSLLEQVTAKHKGICPDGWHIPSDDEWTTLTNFVGSSAGIKLKSSGGWDIRNGSDNYGFSALPGGWAIIDHDTDYNIGNDGYWWTATGFPTTSGGIIVDSYGAYIRRMSQYPYIDGYASKGNLTMYHLSSVRCVQD